MELYEKQYALGTWEIHLQTVAEQQLLSNQKQNVCAYIDTAIDYNNDYLIKQILTKNNYKLISKISSFHGDDYEFFVENHLKCLGVDKVDIMLIHSNRGNWQKVAKLMSYDSRFKEKGVSNFTVDDIKEYKTITGEYPKYCEIEINPYYADINTINFCKENNIKIIAYGILGGKYNAVRNVADFSLPYLLSFAANYADIVIIKPECERHLNEFYDVIHNFKQPKNYTFETCEKYKAIEPMRYDASRIFDKTFIGFPTYNNAVGLNIDITNMHKCEEINEALPDFEMLGDYMTYIRYKYRTNYDMNSYRSYKKVYDYDFLIGDDLAYYVVCLYDENGKLSKINTTGNVKLFKIT